MAALTRLSIYPWLVVAVACIGAFAGQVDASIVQLGLPTLEHAFAAPLDEVSWVALAYVLGFAATLPIFARLAEIAGRKLMYMLGFALFGGFSALCGLAPDLRWLIALRALQGVSGAMLGANAVVILVAAAGPARRGQAMGIYATAQAIGVSTGPALGGLLLGSLSWHWLFWVTVPFAAAASVLSWALVPVSPERRGASRFDFPGALLLAPAIGGGLLVLNEVQAWGPASPRWLATFAVTLLLLALFVWRELRAGAPLLSLLPFRSAAFSGGILAVLVSYAMLYAMFFAMSFALVRGYHDTPLAAGLRLTIIPAVLGLVAPFSGAAGERHPRLVMLSGMAICLASALALFRIFNGPPLGMLPVMGALAAYGLGLGLFVAPNNSTTLGAAPAAQAGEAGGLLNLMRVLGAGTGVALASTLLAADIMRAGIRARSEGVPEPVLRGAVGAVMLLLAGMAVLAGLAASLKGRKAT